MAWTIAMRLRLSCLFDSKSLGMQYGTSGDQMEQRVQCSFEKEAIWIYERSNGRGRSDEWEMLEGQELLALIKDFDAEQAGIERSKHRLAAIR